ncbi:hypothetical protein HDU76_012343 [Blyttiomyces sp. JEL0837]|nr:hypothetical protein HDU76_012343 [Blyttiomyces sp. JEL0837]
MKSWSCALCNDPDINQTHSVVPIFSNELAAMQGFAAVNENLQTIVVSYRGSTDIQNWIADIIFAKTDAKFGPYDHPVHSGFLAEWESVQDQSISAVQQLVSQYPNYPVTFASHSLGAAVSVLGALTMVEKGIISASNTHLALYGLPRIGNKDFSDFVTSVGFASVVRTVNQNDLVPHLPFEFMGFNHFAGERWINRNQQIVSCDDAAHGGEDTNCANTQPPNLSIDAHTSYFGITIPAC